MKRNPKDKGEKKNPFNQRSFCAQFGEKDDNYFDPFTVISERAENLVQVRTQKYKQWLSDDPDALSYSGDKDTFLRNRIHLRLESLTPESSNGKDPTDLQEQFIGNELFHRCLKVYENFEGIVSKVKFKRTIHKAGEAAYDASHEKKELLKLYTKDDLRFVLSQIDLVFEQQQLGYDYRYVHEILNQKDGVLQSLRTIFRR